MDGGTYFSEGASMSTGCCLASLLWEIEVAGYILPVTPARC